MGAQGAWSRAWVNGRPRGCWRGRLRGGSRGGSLGALVGVLLTATSGAAVAGSAPPGGGAALPDQVWVPPPQVLTLTDGDAFEPIAVFMNGVDKGVGPQGAVPEVAVVGAESGDYRFLDLPGLIAALTREDGRFGMAADGSRLVWVVPEGPVRVSVWDSDTGDVTTHTLATRSDHAEPKLTMSPDGSRIAMVLSVLRHGAYQKSTDVMSLDSGALHPVAGCPTPIGWTRDSAGLLCDGSVLRTVPVRSGAVHRLGPFTGAGWPVTLSPREDYATARTRTGDRTVVVDLSTGRHEPLAGADAPALEDPVLGWADDRTAVVVDHGTGLLAADVVDGSTRTLVAVPSQVLDGAGFTVAAGLLAEPPYAATEPDWPLSARTQIILVLGALGAILVGSLLLLEGLHWARRRRLRRKARASLP